MAGDKISPDTVSAYIHCRYRSPPLAFQNHVLCQPRGCITKEKLWKRTVNTHTLHLTTDNNIAKWLTEVSWVKQLHQTTGRRQAENAAFCILLYFDSWYTDWGSNPTLVLALNTPTPKPQSSTTLFLVKAWGVGKEPWLLKMRQTGKTISYVSVLKTGRLSVK